MIIIDNEDLEQATMVWVRLEDEDPNSLTPELALELLADTVDPPEDRLVVFDHIVSMVPNEDGSWTETTEEGEGREQFWRFLLIPENGKSDAAPA